MPFHMTYQYFVQPPTSNRPDLPKANSLVTLSCALCTSSFCGGGGSGGGGGGSGGGGGGDHGVHI